MKFLSFLTATLFMCTWLACGHGSADNSNDSKENIPAATPANIIIPPKTVPLDIAPNKTSTTTPVSATAVGMNPPHGQPGHRCDIAVGAPLNSPPAQQTVAPATTPVNISANQPATTVVTAPGMNPPHGQPGHRCDIAVGAPLNSKPTTPATVPATTKVAPGMNPPHGQPGHRCDIAVGAPLNSKPTTPVTVPATTKVAPGMNPPHGQPGHRCEIAVGAPLDSKPVQVMGIPSKETVTSSQSIPTVTPIKLLPTTPKQNN